MWFRTIIFRRLNKEQESVDCCGNNSKIIMVWYRICGTSPVIASFLVAGLVFIHRYQGTTTADETRNDSTMAIVGKTEGRVRTKRVAGGGERQAESMLHRREQGSYSFDCGCPETCTYDVLSSYAGEYKCGDRIAFLMSENGYSADHACHHVAVEEFPNTSCGGGCNPDMCLPSSRVSFKCGCPSCHDVWDATAGEHTCGARIDWLVGYDGRTEEYACNLVGGIDFPMECGSCDPQTCGEDPTANPTGTPTVNTSPEPTESPSSPPTSPPTPRPPSKAPTTVASLIYCGCDTCTESVYSTMAGDHTCGGRIEWLVDEGGFSLTDACLAVGVEFPSQCGPCIPDTCNVPPPRCGCAQCMTSDTDSPWNRQAGHYTCGDRIEFLMYEEDRTETEACITVANVEFPDICGPACDPRRCGEPSAPATLAPTFAPVPLVDLYKTNLYCFPSPSSRKRFTDVWGKYTIEVKEGTSCGPGNNRFSRETVAVSDSTDLVMQYKMGVGGQWDASEVRILLPPSELPFTYGTYTFHVKSVSIYRAGAAASGEIGDAVLPKDLVLGLFTWDSSDDYSVHQNYNHEVDVEVSRWGWDGNPDVQFLVQPPGSSQMKRFFSDGEGGYDQSDQTYSFTWLPAKMSWSGTTTSGINAAHLYTTEQIVSSGMSLSADYNQCMPSNVEVRINLWNMYGSSAPDGLTDNDVVEVVIGSFQFAPSNVEFVEGGGWCSKHCHCNQSTGYRCLDARCTQV